MRTMIAIICLTTAVLLASDIGETQTLKEENVILKTQIAEKNKEIEFLKAEINRLKNRIKEVQKLYQTKNNPQSTSAQKGNFSDSRTVVYNNKPRSKEWLTRMYNSFADAIAFVDGKYIDVGKSKVGASEFDFEFGIGTRGSTSGTIGGQCVISKIINDSEIIVFRPGATSEEAYSGSTSSYGSFNSPSYGLGLGSNIIFLKLLFHVKNIDTKELKEGTPFNADLVCVGSYDYTEKTGKHLTLASYVIHKPLTTDQFIDALNSGFKLVEYVSYDELNPAGNKVVKVKEIPIE